MRPPHSKFGPLVHNSSRPTCLYFFQAHRSIISKLASSLPLLYNSIGNYTHIRTHPHVHRPTCVQSSSLSHRVCPILIDGTRIYRAAGIAYGLFQYEVNRIVLRPLKSQCQTGAGYLALRGARGQFPPPNFSYEEARYACVPTVAQKYKSSHSTTPNSSTLLSHSFTPLQHSFTRRPRFVHSTAKFLHSMPPDSFTPLQNYFTHRPQIPSLHCKIPSLHDSVWHCHQCALPPPEVATAI